MKVKVTLKFRGREMAHKEFGFQQVNNFIKDLGPWGHPDFEAKLIGKGINVMISPLPRNKRAKHPRGDDHPAAPVQQNGHPNAKSKPQAASAQAAKSQPSSGFSNNPFAQLDSKVES
jgi:translation initiation factor IF-3